MPKYYLCCPRHEPYQIEALFLLERQREEQQREHHGEHGALDDGFGVHVQEDGAREAPDANDAGVHQRAQDAQLLVVEPHRVLDLGGCCADGTLAYVK